MQKQLSAIWYGEECVVNLSMPPEATDDEIRKAAFEAHNSVPICNEGETPYEKTQKILFGTIKRYNTIDVAPQPGQKLKYRGKEAGTVISTAGGICYYHDPSQAMPENGPLGRNEYPAGANSSFIWLFPKDKLNRMFTWAI